MILWDIISNSWRPGLEILILAVGIYYAFFFVRGTRGAPVVTGFLVLLLALTLLTYLLQLEILSWLLRNFFAFFAIAVVVIFQPELRRILAELGNQPLFSSVHEQRENIEVITQAAARMSEMRIGALIAIEQSILLQEVVESGIGVDCEATPEMLETIFFPNNAIHDGGVIIKGDRIAYAACIFPLTQRQDLNKSLGMRHRAAIGLTEETDAVVVAVSEENGAISYAYKGQLVRGLREEELRAFLTSVFVHPGKPHSTWDGWRAWLNRTGRRRNPADLNLLDPPDTMFSRRLIKENLGLKCFSLLLAALIWFTIRFGLHYHVSLTPNNPMDRRIFGPLPITVMTEAADLRAFRVVPSEVTVTVAGSPEALQSLADREIQVFVNLVDLEDIGGMIKKIDVFPPAGITVLKVNPPVVQIERLKNDAKNPPQ